MTSIDIQIYCTPIQPAWGDWHCEACVDVLIWQHSAILTCWRTVSCDLHSVASLRFGGTCRPVWPWKCLSRRHYTSHWCFSSNHDSVSQSCGCSKKYIQKISLIAKQLRLRDTYESLFLFFTVKELFKTVWCSNDDIVNALRNRS